MIKMKTCPFCGSSVKNEDIFCNQCGKNLVQNCPNCGEQIEIDAVFCRECGFELNKSETEKKEASAATQIVPIYKKWWFWLVAAVAVIGLVLLFSSGGTQGSDTAMEEPEETVTESVTEEETGSQPTEAQENEITDKEKAEEIAVFHETVDAAIEEAFPKSSESKSPDQSDKKKESMDIETFQKTMEPALEEVFGKGYFEAELDQEDHLYNVYVWIDGGKDAMEAAQDGGSEDVAYWNARVGLLLETSKKIKEKLDSAGLSDWSVTLSLLDEDSHTDIYAITKDGYAYYEIIEDGKLDT